MIIDAIQYARSRMRVLGKSQWIDGYSDKNIPETRRACTYFIRVNQGEGIRNNQSDQEIELPIELELNVAAGRDNRALRDEAIRICDLVIADMIKIENRLTFSDGLKDWRLVRFNIDPIDESNDNGFIVRIEFRAFIIISSE